MAENDCSSIMIKDECENSHHREAENSADRFKSSLVIQLTSKQKIQTLSEDKEPNFNSSNQKTERKKVSFQEHTTDIDTQLNTRVYCSSIPKEIIPNGCPKPNNNNLEARESETKILDLNAQNDSSSKCVEYVTPDKEEIAVISGEGDILKVVQQFLEQDTHVLENIEITEDQELNSFRDQYCEAIQSKMESLKQISIPKARLAFVTEMVESSHQARESKTAGSVTDNSVADQVEEGQEPGSRVISIDSEENEDHIETQAIAESLNHQTEVIVNGFDHASSADTESSETSLENAIVDRSSILERKEELRKLWEKKMAEEQQAVVVEEIVHIKEEVADVKITAHANGTAKMVNGDAIKTEIEDNSQSKDLSTVETEKLIDISNVGEAKPCRMNGTANLIDIDENSNIEEITKSESTLDVLQVSDETNSIVETSVVETTEQVFTSTLQQTLVITKTEESSQVEEVSSVVQSSTTVGLEDHEDFEEIERRIEAEESQAQETEPKKLEPAIEVIETNADELDLPKELETNGMLEEPDEKAEHPLSSNADSLEGLDHQGDIEEEEDFVCVGDAVFAADLDATGKDSVAMNGYTASPVEPAAENGEQEEKTFDDHFVLDTRELESPSSDRNNEKQSKKLSQIKTEQPYSTCTTETKIAMEIREMREREEELKLMRERQAQVSPLPQTPQQNAPKAASPINKVTAVQKSKQPSGYIPNNAPKVQATPGYRVSSVFGRSNSQVSKDDNKTTQRNFNKESPVEREIRLAKDREEELRKQKGLPPREDDSFVKPSQVKSAQAKVFGKMINAENSRLQATAKIQHEIEEQTMRELALRESGSIQTLSSERTDSKVSKLKPLDTPECLSPTFTNGNNSPSYANGNYTNGHISPDILSKRSTPSPTGSSSSYTTASRSSPMMGVSGINKGISMQKFIASRGKETTFSASRNGPFTAKQDNYYNQDIITAARTIPEPGKLKRTLSVESKIQQEILEMKLREEELKLLHTGQSPMPVENGEQHNGLLRSPMEYQNGQTETQEACPRKSNLIAQWEQRIQNAA